MRDHEIEDIEIDLLLEAIHARYGYDLRGYARASMRRRILAARATSGVSNLGELQHRLLREPAFFAKVFDNLTVRVTEMFRDPTFHREFRKRVVPILRTYPVLRIWHSGCSTGEEVFSSAIVLTEEGLYERTQIYATDVSPSALEHAKDGMYASERAAGFGENYRAAGGTGDLADYYTAAYEQFAMRETLKRNILFFPHNLVSDHAFGEMHVIFCRNVLIYFNGDLRRRVLDTLAKSLCPGGFLCLGSSERLQPGIHEGFSEFSSEERIYRRGP